jgi:hypothetical protein
MSTNLGSRWDQARIDASNGAADSLVLCVQAVLRGYGHGATYDQLSALGGAAAASTDPQEFLGNVARGFALEIRELHPAQAAPTPPTPREFDWHFRDSYLPFIRAALERDEPVLAWMGWPPPHESDWGIVTGIDAATGQCRGWTPGGPRRLVSSPVQVYLLSPARR